MKIAYIFHGHARTWEQCYTSFFDNIFSDNPGDVFIHTWDTLNTNLSSHWSNYKQLTQEDLNVSNKKLDAEKLYEIFKPKKLIVEKHQNVLFDGIEMASTKLKAMHGVKNMLYSSKKCFNEAKKDNYDLYFSLRLDILWQSKINLQNLNLDTLWCPVLEWPGEKRMAWDVFMIASKKNMKIKTSYLNFINKYWLDKKDSENILYEDALTDYLVDNKINFDFIDLKWDLVRLFK